MDTIVTSQSAKQTLNAHSIDLFDSKTVYRHSALDFFKKKLSSIILNTRNCLGSTVQNYTTIHNCMYAFPFLSARVPVC
jgi:hypothetical protein